MAKRRTGNQIVSLEGEKLKKLSKLIYTQEVNGMKNNPFKSEYDRRLHLDECRNAYLNSLSLIQLASDFSESKSEPKNNAEHEQKKSEIISSLNEYLQYAVGYAYSCIPNINLRQEYLKRVKEHGAELKTEIRGLDSSEQTIAKAEELFNRIQTFKTTTYEAIFAKADKPFRVLSRVTRPSLRNFSKTFNMVQRKFLLEIPAVYNRQFGATVATDYTTGEMIEAMVDSLANENEILKQGSRVFKGVGRTIIFLTAAMMVVDAATTQGGAGAKVEALAKDVSNFAVGYYIGGLAESVTVWGAEAVLGATLIGASVLASFAVGVIAIGVGFAVGYFAAPFVSKGIDWIFGHIHKWFEKKHSPEEEKRGRSGEPKLTVSNIQTYVTPPPDGLALANRLAHVGAN